MRTLRSVIKTYLPKDLVKILRRIATKVQMLIPDFHHPDPKLIACIPRKEISKIRRLPRKLESTVLLFERRIRFPDGYWFMHSMDELFVEEVYRFNSVKKDPYIIDCGANIGLSIIYFKKLFPLARIVAFEPDKDIFRALNENIEQFKFDNIQLINKGVWSEERTLSFLAEGTLGGKVIDEKSVAPSGIGVMSIPTVRLKDHLHEKVEFLKIDIEGAEYDVLIDCAAALKNVELLFVEYHSSPEKPQRLNEILAVITQAGFRYHIKGASHAVEFPFIDSQKQTWFDLQLNIFCYRTESRN